MSATGYQSSFAVVAVDGSDEGYAAVRFAAEQAGRQGLALRLVHVMPAYLPVGPLLMVADDDGLAGYASEAMAGATRLVAEVAPDVAVTTHILLGGRVAQIVSFAADADFIVVGRRPSGAMDRAWSGGTLDGVASRAKPPVFVVPPVADPDEVHGRVLAAYKGPDHAAELFDAAFSTADELGAELEVLHAWKLSAGYDDMIARRVSEATWSREQKAKIWSDLVPWQEAYPEVRVRLRVSHDYPVKALVEATLHADRLILVKPLHGSAVHHLGRTARGVLRRASCPVEVVPAHSVVAPATPQTAVASERGVGMPAEGRPT